MQIIIKNSKIFLLRSRVDPGNTQGKHVQDVYTDIEKLCINVPGAGMRLYCSFISNSVHT